MRDFSSWTVYRDVTIGMISGGLACGARRVCGFRSIMLGVAIVARDGLWIRVTIAG